LFEYQTLFDARGDLYNRANDLHPEARAEEAAALLEHLALAPGARWLDVYAGGGYLSRRAALAGLPRAEISCDGSLQFLRSGELGARACVARGQRLPFPAGRFTAVGCLAALHHAEDPRALCGELLRVAAPGGRAAVGDVADGSAAAEFLNGFVDRHTASGHAGRFYSVAALEGLLGAAGGERLRGERRELAWTLPSRAGAVAFFRDLFGLEPATRDAEIEAALRGLGAREEAAGLRVPWTMHFVSAARA
jgi:SAM-dependent methyltransferase